MLTYDSRCFTTDAAGNHRGKTLAHPARVATFDAAGNQTGWRTVDSTGAFLVGELERLDMRLHEPLAAVTWGRDIDLREDVTIANETSSFTLSTYASGAGLGVAAPTGAGGKAWVGKDTTQITGISVDLAKVPHNLYPWAIELKYTILELESAALLGRPIDQQKYSGMQLKHQMDVDGMVYVGDTEQTVYGLVNADSAPANTGQVTSVSIAPVGSQNSTLWASKTPDEILLDVNQILNAAWANAGWAFPPNRLLLPTTDYSLISTQKVSTAGNVSTLRYVLENNLLTTSGMAQLRIYPLKWCNNTGTGVANSGRMVAYTKDPERVRYPMTLMQRTPLQFDGLYQKSTYFCRLGVTEIVYPECIAYIDGI